MLKNAACLQEAPQNRSSPVNLCFGLPHLYNHSVGDCLYSAMLYEWMSSVMRLKEILERSHEQLGARKLAQLANSPQLTRFLHTSRNLHGLFPVHRRQIPCKGRGEWLLRVDDFWRPRRGSQLTETPTSTKEFPMLTGISRKNSVIWKKLVYQYIAFLCFPNRGQKTQVWVPALSLGKQLWPLWASV